MYINTATGQYPFSEQDIREALPNTSFSIPFVPPAEYAYVFPYPRPTFDPLIRVAREIAPELTVAGTWEQRWTVAPRFVEYTDEAGVTHTVAAQEAAAIAADLSLKRSTAIGRVKALRDLKTENGGYLAGGKWFHSDLVSRTQQIGLILMGANIPAGLQWKTLDGSFITMTPTLAGQVLAAAGGQDAALFAHAETLIGQINAAADPTTVDVSAGWPTTFGDV